MRAFPVSHARVRIKMEALSQRQVTQLLLDWSAGDNEALNKLMPLLYQELKRMARYYMRRERAGHTLQTSALVNEAYIRLVDYKKMRWQDRAHFLAVAAQAMRRILVEHARGRTRAKRGGDARKVSLDEAATLADEKAADIVALDLALNSLAEFDPRKSQIVELRYFGGLNIEETAEVLGVSPATVKREWTTAKIWLHREVNR
ncbi:MAG TPA: sigma-70 family RNA polymerase sigma factor [Blastocatellia bacterium]|nr:sigma-70 family RNA polymerase sigma factor [Blastocatellia bacterium]